MMVVIATVMVATSTIVWGDGDCKYSGRNISLGVDVRFLVVVEMDGGSGHNKMVHIKWWRCKSILWRWWYFWNGLDWIYFILFCRFGDEIVVMVMVMVMGMCIVVVVLREYGDGRILFIIIIIFKYLV